MTVDSWDEFRMQVREHQATFLLGKKITGDATDFDKLHHYKRAREYHLRQADRYKEMMDAVYSKFSAF